jgi:PAS domain S-box-containing protein
MLPRDGLLILDTNARLLYASKRMAEILGIPRAKMHGRQFFEYVLPDDVPVLQLLDHENDERTNRFRFRVRRGDGSVIWVDMDTSPLFDVSGRIKGTIGIFRIASLLDFQDEIPSEIHVNGRAVTV